MPLVLLIDLVAPLEKIADCIGRLALPLAHLNRVIELVGNCQER
jgi:hypothetical protein